MVIAYFSDLLVPFGLCRPGMKFVQGPFGEKFCYTPSGFEGQPCDRQTDCGTGGCILVDENRTTGKGICKDVAFGCIQTIDEDGNIGPMICID